MLAFRMGWLIVVPVALGMALRAMIISWASPAAHVVSVIFVILYGISTWKILRGWK